MNQPVWILIVIAIIAAMGQSFGELTRYWLRRKRSQADQKPEQNQPKAEYGRESWKYKLWGLALKVVGLVPPVAGALWLLLGDWPLDKSWVAVFVICAMSITYQLCVNSAITMANIAVQARDPLIVGIGRNTRKLAKVVESHHEKLEALPPPEKTEVRPKQPKD